MLASGLKNIASVAEKWVCCAYLPETANIDTVDDEHFAVFNWESPSKWVDVRSYVHQGSPAKIHALSLNHFQIVDCVNTGAVSPKFGGQLVPWVDFKRLTTPQTQLLFCTRRILGPSI